MPENVTDLTGLIARVREAMGPDRTIEASMAQLFFSRREAMIHKAHDLAMHRYTASIDAITALIEKRLPGVMRRVQDNPDDGGATAMLILPDGALHRADAATWPLALTLAFLMAIQSEKNDG